MIHTSKQSVIGVVFNERKDRVLLIKRCDVPVWVLPGGGVEENETSEQAVVREMREETGLNVTILRRVATYSPINALANLTHVFECKADYGELSRGNETRDLGYFSIDNLPHPFFFVHRDWLIDTKKMLPTTLEKPLHQVTYTALVKYFFRHPLHVLRFALSRLGYPINSR